MEKENLPEKVEPVVTGTTKVHKKNWFQRTGEILFAQTDRDTIGKYLVNDIVVPYFRKVVFDLVTSTLDMFLYGGSAPSNRVQPNRTNTYTNYNSGYSYRAQASNQPKPITGTEVFNFDKIVFSSKRDAVAVLDGMCDILDRYSLVTVAQFYSLANCSIDNVQANKFGWFDLSGAEIVRDSSGFYVKLPKACPLD